MGFPVRHYEDAIRVLSQVTFDGRLYLLTIKPYKEPRSLDQNKKLHAMLRDIALHTGFTEHETKEICKAKFAPLVTKSFGKGQITLPKGTSEMSTDECSQFVERLYALGAELNVTWSEPDGS